MCLSQWKVMVPIIIIYRVPFSVLMSLSKYLSEWKIMVPILFTGCLFQLSKCFIRMEIVPMLFIGYLFDYGVCSPIIASPQACRQAS